MINAASSRDFDRRSEPGKRQTVPGSNDLFIAKRFDPLFPLGEKFSFCFGDERFDHRFFFPEIFRRLLDGQDRMQDIFFFEISLVTDIVDAAENFTGLCAEQSANFIGSPNEEFTFLALAIGILSRIKTASGLKHLAQQIVRGFLNYRFKKSFAGDRVRVRINGEKLGIVIEHFFKMGHQPFRVHRIAMKAAAEMIIDAALSHFGERVNDHFQIAFIFRVMKMAQE